MLPHPMGSIRQNADGLETHPDHVSYEDALNAIF